MSDQAQGSNSKVLSWDKFSKAVWNWNPDDKHTKMLMKDVPRLENVDVYNVYDQGLTISSQSLLLSSAENIVNNCNMEISIEVNPIGLLQELCMARHYPFPIYTFSVENLKENEPRFNVECLLSLYVSSGIASTKKAAKKIAAYEMYKQIEKLASEDVHEIVDNESETQSTNMAAKEVAAYEMYKQIEKLASEDVHEIVDNESATQSTNMAAKEVAAYEMYKQIEKLASEDVHEIVDNESATQSTNMAAKEVAAYEMYKQIEKLASEDVHEIVDNESATQSTNMAAKEVAAYEMYKQIEKLTSEDVHEIVDNESATQSTNMAAKEVAAYEMYKQTEKLVSEDVHEIIDNVYEVASDKMVSSLCDESATQSKTFFGLIDAPKTPHLQSIERNSNKYKLTAADTLKIISEKDCWFLEVNPIGSLQELCLFCHFPYPIYTFSIYNLKEYEQRFKVECVILFHTTSGIASSKKVAKKIAAFEMYKQIEKLASEDVHGIVDNESATQSTNEAAKEVVAYEKYKQIEILASEDVHEIIDNECVYEVASDKMVSSLCDESATQSKTCFGSIDAPKTPHLQTIEMKHFDETLHLPSTV